MQTVRAFPALSFDDPVLLTAAPGDRDRLFVVERAGRILVFDNDDLVASAQVFLDIRDRVLDSGSEEGLLGLAFHPDYFSNGRFYVYYSASSPRRTVLARYTVSADPDVGDRDSEEILLRIDQPYSNHNGGMIAFGPDDMLYVAVGDGGSSNDPGNNAQDLGNLLGKILRLDADGNAPNDNPLVGQAGVRDEIWAYGLRNPWRFSFDRDDGTLWAGDVGQNAREEVDIVVEGGNYGWRVYEGDRSANNPNGLPASSFRGPVIDYPRSQGGSVIGGYVYRGDRLPSLQGAYVYGDYLSGRIWALVWDGARLVSNTEIAAVASPSSFGEDADGRLYIVAYGGAIHRLVGGSGPDAPPLLSQTGLFRDTANLVPAPGIIEYGVNAPVWADGAEVRRWIALPGSARITFRSTGAWEFPVGTVLAQHFRLSGRHVETRVLVRALGGWRGYSYQWNPAQTDADLLDSGDTETIGSQEWTYPGRADCMSCHAGSAGTVLGVNTRQLNREFDYPAATDNQLRAWNHIRLFTAIIALHTSYESFEDPMDSTASTDERARAYMEVNCASCHRPGGPAPVDMDLAYDTAEDQMRIVNVAAVSGGVRVDAGSRATSVLWQRMSLRGAAQMPPLGTNVVDTAALDLLGTWIESR
jgi:uncharacterized repeat protein (TIGR03806 family)